MSWEDWFRKEDELKARALRLCEGYPPQFNLEAVKDLLRQADRMGFDVTRRTSEPQSEERK